MPENKEDTWFQTIQIQFKDPESGEVRDHYFVGKALMSPEQIELYKETPIEELIVNFFIDKPVSYNQMMTEKARREGKKDNETTQ